MSTATVTARPLSRWKAKYLLFAFVGAMFVYVLGHNESFLVNPRAPVWQHYQPFKWWLLPHGIAGACALLLGPMQFSDRLRQRYAKLHRVAGRFYVAGALIASVMGIYVQHFKERLGDPRSFTMISVTHGGLWMLTTGIALMFILKGKVQHHRQWMTRSFAVGPGVFLGARVALGLTGLENSSIGMIQAVIWMCIAFSIPIADMVLQWQELSRTRAPLARAAAAAR
jgi:uncharacterized membrane protein